jgi:hypothetical protein
MEVSMSDTGEVHYRTDVDYGEPIEGIAWPRGVTIEGEFEYRIAEWAFEPTPKAEFYRSHYGLQDPPLEWDDPWILAILTLAMTALAALAFRIGRSKFRKRAIRSSVANPSSSEEPTVR